MVCLLVIIFLYGEASAQDKDTEDTYSISLVQTAEVDADKEIHEIDNKRILTERYTVKKGDYLWKILRKKGLMKKRKLQETLSLLKKLNPSLTNLNLIHPGEKIVIPLIISPIGVKTPVELKTPAPTPIKKIKDLALEYYTVKPGDSLIKVVKDRFKIPDKDLHNEYLEMLKKLNPEIRNLNSIYPGQKIKLPIYSPQVIKRAIKTDKPVQPEVLMQRKAIRNTGRQLGRIFTRIGEDWVQTGEHFIPLKAGGQINLKAPSYPIINLSSGIRIIVDLFNDLPKKMAGLIASNWDNYRIVHLGKDYDLRKALNRILPLCGYDKVYLSGEPLDLGGEIKLRITADWMIRQTDESTENGQKLIMITLIDDRSAGTPVGIKGFLDSLGVRVLDFPSSGESINESNNGAEAYRPADTPGLIGMILDLTGNRYSEKVEIPIFQRKIKDFNLIIKADFFLNLDGKDRIIDLGGLDSEIVSLLEEHQFMVLSLRGEKDPAIILKKVFGFIGVQFDSSPHSFMAADRDETRNIRLTIPGIIFKDKGGQAFIATRLILPREIERFLSRKGYRVFILSPSLGVDDGRRKNRKQKTGSQKIGGLKASSEENYGVP